MKNNRYILIWMLAVMLPLQALAQSVTYNHDDCIAITAMVP